MSSRTPRSIKTPCVGICSTVYGDAVCRGCSRFHHEIIHWNRYTENQKALVWQRLEHAIVTVLSNKFVIADQSKLQQTLQTHKVRYQQHLDPFCWVNSLLNELDRIGINLDTCGIDILPAFKSFTLPGLITLIQNEIYELSRAYYDQQIERAFRHSDFLLTEQ